MQNKPLLPSAYAGSVLWYAIALQCRAFLLDDVSPFQKPSLSNRTYILGPNGVQMLNVPINRKQKRAPLQEIEISYAENWQKDHWKALETAYGSTPYFEILAPELLPLYKSKENLMFDFNLKIQNLILNWLDERIDFNLKSNFDEKVDSLNLFEFLKPNRDPGINFPKYDQCFLEKHGFVPNLSILDLFFHLGPETNAYLLKIEIPFLKNPNH